MMLKWRRHLDPCRLDIKPTRKYPIDNKSTSIWVVFTIWDRGNSNAKIQFGIHDFCIPPDLSEFGMNSLVLSLMHFRLCFQHLGPKSTLCTNLYQVITRCLPSYKDKEALFYYLIAFWHFVTHDSHTYPVKYADLFAVIYIIMCIIWLFVTM